MSGVFDIFQSKENVTIIRENISQTIEGEYGQKIAYRYDTLIEGKMRELISRVPEKVPADKTKKEYILMMNKKLISMVLPTIRANAIKERGRSGSTGTGAANSLYPGQGGAQGKPRTPMMEDPQDLLRGPGAREQFNLPLEDMSSRMIPDHPRGNGGGGGPGERMLQRMDGERGIYNQFQNGPPTTMPKFHEEVPEKRPAETLAMYNQLVSRYQEEKVKVGEAPDDLDLGAKVPAGGDDRERERGRDREQENQNPFARRKIVLRKTKAVAATPESTSLEDLEKIGANPSETKHQDLLSFPGPNSGPYLGMVPKSGPTYRTTYIHISSNYRNLEYQKSPSSIRLYLTRFHDADDPYIAFKLPEYVDKFGNQIHDAFEYQWDMQNHIHIPYLKKLQAISVESVKIYQGEFVAGNPKIYVELGPRKRGSGKGGDGDGEDEGGDEGKIAPYYHNKSHQKCSLLTYNKTEEVYQPFAGGLEGGDPFVDIKSVIQQGYLQVNLYDLYHQYIHFEHDHRVVKKVTTQLARSEDRAQSSRESSLDEDNERDDGDLISLVIDNGDRMMEGKRIYLYSMLPEEEKRYVEMSDNVLVESITKIMDREEDGMTVFKMIGLNTEDSNEENHYRVNFREMFNRALQSMEEDQHIDISQLFYFVIQQQVGNRQVIYYCQIEYIDELGHVVLSHREGNAIVENYMNTEQFGFIKKNFRGKQSDDVSSLFRRSGHRVMKVIEGGGENGMITYKIQKPSADFAMPVDLECFLIHQPYEIDVVLKAQFLA